MTGAELAEIFRRLTELVDGPSHVQRLAFVSVPGLQIVYTDPELDVPDEEPAASPAAARARRYRNRKRDGERDAGVTRTVTERDGERDANRDGVTFSPPRSPSLSSLTLSNDLGNEREERTGDRDVRHVGSVTERDAVTVCPLNIVERAQSLGLIEELASKLKATPGQVRASAEEFLAYWTIGAGIGKRRPHWMAKLREHVRRSAQEGRLPAAAASEPGAVPEMHPVAKARLARYTAEREAAIAKAAAEHDAKGLTPVRDLRALTEGIGG